MRRNVCERNRIEQYVGAMVLAVVGSLAAVLSPASGTGFYVIADGPCIEQPSLELPADCDPNKVAGHLIDVLTVPAGKFNRTGGLCDPCDFPIDIELLAAPAGFSVSIDPNAGTWTIAGELVPGDHGLVARGRNRPRFGEPNDVIVTVYVRATSPVNARPILR
jgi:hypothetical protein